MAGERINPEGLLELLHAETGGYVPASAILQTEGGLLASLVPNQAALLADIRDASAYLQILEAKLIELKTEISNNGAKIAQSNVFLSEVAEFDVALNAVSSATDSLESLGGISNALLTEVRDKIGLLLAKIPTSLGAKLRTESLSVALASDSTIFTSLTNIFNSLSDGTANTALSYLSTIAGTQFWKTPAKINSASPILNAVSAATSSAAYSIGTQTEALMLQNFFSVSGASAQFAVELRVTAGASSLSDKTYYYRGDVSSPYLASAGAYPGESPIVVPTHGHAQVLVHLSAIAGGGNVTTYAKEIK